MAVKDMREILEDVRFQDLAGEIGKLRIPDNVHVRVIIETIDELPEQKSGRPDEADLRFLEAIEKMPTADFPEDLSYQHDHYLYGLPKKP